MIVLIKKTTNNWIEVTFSDENKDKECHYFSGEKEHIDSLNLKIKEYKITLTKEQEDLIKETKANFIYPTDEEIAKEQLEHKINEALAYLSSTDYKMTVDYFSTLSKDIQDELILKRNDAREFIRANS